MKAIILGLALTAVTAAAAQDKFVPPQVKTGLWEQTITMTRQGTLGLPESMLSRMTPEQRARAEARLKAGEQPYTHTETSQSCLTKKDIDDWRIFKSPDVSCKQLIVKSTGTELDAQWDCELQGGISGKGTVHFDILNPENARGTVHTIADGNGHHMVVDSKMSSKWIGSDCSKMRKNEE